MQNITSSSTVPAQNPQTSVPDPEYERLNDAELVEFMAAGDQEACAVLYGRHSREMSAWLEHKVKNLLNYPAEHFVNETFFRAFNSAKSFVLKAGTPSTKITVVVKRWLYNILRNVWIDSFRSTPSQSGKPDTNGEGMFVLSEPASQEQTSSRRLVLVEKFLANLQEDERSLLAMTGSFFDLSKNRVEIPNDIVEPLCRDMGLTRSSLRVRRKRLLEDLKSYIVANE